MVYGCLQSTDFSTELKSTKVQTRSAPEMSNLVCAVPLNDGLGNVLSIYSLASLGGALVLKPLVLLIVGRLVVCSASISVDRQTHRPTTVTLAAHACRRLINPHVILPNIPYVTRITRP